jgi:hypothetical protein
MAVMRAASDAARTRCKEHQVKSRLEEQIDFDASIHLIYRREGILSLALQIR